MGLDFEPVTWLLWMFVLHTQWLYKSAEISVTFQNLRHGNPVKV